MGLFMTASEAKRLVWRSLPAIGEIAMVVGVALAINTIAAQAFYVPSGSMEPTLLIGDELMVSKFPYGFSRYSVPLGLGPSAPTRLFGRLWINGEEVSLRRDGFGEVEEADGTTARAPRYVETLPGGPEHPIFKFTWDGPLDNTDVFAVAPGHVFVMGDNRDNSADSRLSPIAGGVGFVPVENLVGRVDVVLGSWDLGLLQQPISTWPSGLRLSRFFSQVH